MPKPEETKMDECKIGDTVKLKSGGPLMTVSGVVTESPQDGCKIVECAWFDDAGTFTSARFKCGCLRASDAP